MVKGKPVHEDLIHEYPAVGKYRLRMLSSTKQTEYFDVREYVDTEKFKGFTRRGVRLIDKHQVQTLRDSLTDALERGWFD